MEPGCVIASTDDISGPLQGGRTATSPSATLETGESARQLHSRVWAGLGVGVSHRGSGGKLGIEHDVFLLVEPDDLVVFDAEAIISQKHTQVGLWQICLEPPTATGYCEHVMADENRHLVSVRRTYETCQRPEKHVLLTTDPTVAARWQRASEAWPANDRCQELPEIKLKGVAIDETDELLAASLVAQSFLAYGVDTTDPTGCAARSHAITRPVAAPTDHTDRDTRRSSGSQPILRLHGAAMPEAQHPETTASQPSPHTDEPDQPSHSAKSPGQTTDHPAWRGQRLFSLVFSVAAIILTAPLYPLILLAIWIEDGRPFFFSQRRQTMGGADFDCYKFRTMHRGADAEKEDLDARNACDGPQFFIEDDPRLLRVGRFLRRFHLDELPQFFNVLRGDMNVVGPRPSPDNENQFCPAWRESRLSVRPGVTGLWQVNRTRAPNRDFQEWIRYDMDYVQRCSWHLDIAIILRTLARMIWKARRGKTST